jgi:choline dehydrogenase-like flavoprotein
MFIDARSIDDGRVFERDVCVVGAGAAGIALAVSLAEAGLDVDLIESGGFEPEDTTQALAFAKVDGLDMYTARLRYFGGTTNHWGGWCRPLDPFEFEAHPWIPDSGWPITRRELDPYYEKAREVIGLPHAHYRFDPAEQGAESDPPLLGKDRKDFEPVIWRRTQPSPTRMGSKYRATIDRSPRIRCFLRANATELVPHSSGRRIQTLRAATLTGRTLHFRARRFVLCTGAIENARLLLLSDSVIRGGVGNQNGLVGRYFADHGFRQMGLLLVPEHPSPRIFQEERFLAALPKEGMRIDGVGFASSLALREQHHLLGFSVIAYVRLKYIQAYRTAVAVGALTSASRGGAPGETPIRRARAFNLNIVPEQSPNPESRVRLHEERDALGLRKAVLDLKTRELDHRSRRESARRLAIAVARSGSGRIRLERHEEDKWTAGLGGHQTGTTRMADDPKKGVTDRNARVHGVENLFITGGGLYPTAGWQHPTLTIFALALRLASFLKAEAKRSQA